MVRLAQGGERQRVGGGAVEGEEHLAVGLEGLAQEVGGLGRPAVVAVAGLVAAVRLGHGGERLGADAGVVVARELSAGGAGAHPAIVDDGGRSSIRPGWRTRLGRRRQGLLVASPRERERARARGESGLGRVHGFAFVSENGASHDPTSSRDGSHRSRPGARAAGDLLRARSTAPAGRRRHRAAGAGAAPHPQRLPRPARPGQGPGRAARGIRRGPGGLAPVGPQRRRGPHRAGPRRRPGGRVAAGLGAPPGRADRVVREPVRERRLPVRRRRRAQVASGPAAPRLRAAAPGVARSGLRRRGHHRKPRAGRGPDGAAAPPGRRQPPERPVPRQDLAGRSLPHARGQRRRSLHRALDPAGVRGEAGERCRGGVHRGGDARGQGHGGGVGRGRARVPRRGRDRQPVRGRPEGQGSPGHHRAHAPGR